MYVKITNCTVPINYRTGYMKSRKNQNINTEISNEILNEYTTKDIIKMMLNGQISYSVRFIVTTSSKIILPKVYKEPDTKEDIRLKKLQSL